MPANLFACRPCFRQLPHRLRQGIVQTKGRKYLDAERLAAVHAAEDYLEHLRTRRQPQPGTIRVPPHTFGGGDVAPAPDAMTRAMQRLAKDAGL